MDNAKIAVKNAADYSPSPPSGPAPEGPLTSAIPLEYAGMRLDVALAQLFPEYSRSRLQSWIKEGLVDVAGATPDAKSKVYGGESVRIAVPVAPIFSEQAEDIALSVVFEDAQIIIVNKPAGLVVHPGNGNAAGTMMNALLHHSPQLEQIPRAGIVHRLDKDTSGLLVVAKTLIAQTDLVRQLQARTVKRHYLALVHGNVDRDDMVDAPLGRHPVHRTKMAVVKADGPDAREARTHFFVRERFLKSTLLECRLETGRTHQIRVHMASVGHPLVGDPVYGKSRSGDACLDAFSRQALHAWRLAVVHPESGKEMSWEAELPADFSQLLEQLRVQVRDA